MVHYDVSEGVCTLRLDAPPLNTISLALLEELRSAIARAGVDPDVRAIVITGSPEHFSAGADIDLFKQINTADDAVGLSRTFQEAFQVVEDSSKPVVAAVAGHVLGGALELAAACHARVCTEQTRFSMPEINLGFSPGAGGPTRLPRLVGVPKALEMLLSGKPIGAREAREVGLVDAVCPAEDLLTTARNVIESNDALRCTCDLKEKVADGEANAAAFEQARQNLANVRPEIIAPAKIVEAVRAGLDESFQAGLKAEQESFAECVGTPAAQNKIYLFFATSQTSKVPELADLAPRPVAKAAVIGMGSMGSGIAHALMQAGVPVVVYDEQPAAVERGLGRIRRSLEKRVAQGRLTADRLEAMMGLARTANGWQDIADADLVVEAVFEDVEIKRDVLRPLESVCRADAVLATNTSTISLEELAAEMQHGGRLVGMHFFNPAQRMPLVEVIRGDGTLPEVVATAMKFAKAIRKTPVLVNSREGFLVNRLFVPYLKEAFWLLEDGAEAADVDRAAVEFGMAMGPLTLIDMAGIDVLVFTDRVMSRAFPWHGTLSPIATQLVERGQAGQKAGGGIYKYVEGDYTPHRSDLADEIVADVRRAGGLVARDVPADEIAERLMLRMVAEAFRVLEEGVARSESDVDAAMVLAVGFPDFRGGVLKYARDLGLRHVQSRLEHLTKRFGERFAPCELLRSMSVNDE